MNDSYRLFLELRNKAMLDASLCSPPKRVDTPALQRVYASAGAVNALMDGVPPDCRRKLELEAMFHAGILKDEGVTKAALDELSATMNHLDRLMNENPALKDELVSIMWALIRNYGMIIRNFVLDQRSREQSTMKPLIDRNRSSAAIQERAKELAAHHWSTDVHQKLSVIVVAEAVRTELIAEGIPGKGLAQATGIKKWIAPDAPDYARKPGRRK